MRTEIKLVEILEQTGLPVSYFSFEEPIPPLPYLLYLDDGTENFKADNVVYEEIPGYRVELYTKQKNTQTEKLIQEVFKNNRIVWEKESFPIPEEGFHRTVYYL